MITQSAICYKFTRAFENVVKEVMFNPVWTQDYNGCWNGAVKGSAAPSLAAGEVAKTVDDAGRRAIFIGTAKGNIVLFDRLCHTSAVGVAVHYQVPWSQTLNWLFAGSGVVNETTLFQLINPENPIENIGAMVTNV